MAPKGTGDDGDELTLSEAAELLGVHYMTAYRYVRTGRLAAERHGSQWVVRRSSLASVRAANEPGRARSGGDGGRRRDYTSELVALLTGGDEPEAWRLVQDALVASFTLEQLYLEVLVPAMASVGEEWEAGRLTVAAEHRATALAHRLVGRLGPSFLRRGPARGLVVLGAPAGDHHALATALVADPLRGRGFRVADLGADTPPQSFAEVVARDDRTWAVGIACSVPVGDEVLDATVEAIHAVRPVPVLLGGRAIPGPDYAAARGADAYSESCTAALAWFDREPEGSGPAP